MSDGDVTRLKMLTVNLIPGHLGYHEGASNEKEVRHAADSQDVGAGARGTRVLAFPFR